jgi:hypothetical protein
MGLGHIAQHAEAGMLVQFLVGDDSVVGAEAGGTGDNVSGAGGEGVDS